MPPRLIIFLAFSVDPLRNSGSLEYLKWSKAFWSFSSLVDSNECMSGSVGNSGSLEILKWPKAFWSFSSLVDSNECMPGRVVNSTLRH